jgi:hypothetical protein
MQRNKLNKKNGTFKKNSNFEATDYLDNTTGRKVDFNKNFENYSEIEKIKL